MAKTDHPSYGKTDTVNKWTPHLLPSVFQDGLYFLHENVRGEHSIQSINGKTRAEAALAKAIKRSEKA